MLKAERVLITGGAGLVGSHIADGLIQGGFSGEIVILDNFTRGTRRNLAWALEQGDVRVVEGDICDRNLVQDLMSGVDYLFHQAAIRITQCAEEPRLALEVMADGTYNILEAAVEATVQKVVAASSASIYGQADEFPTTELHHPYNDRTIYGATKVFNEGLLRSFNEMFGLDYVALRYFNVYGPRMDIHGVYTELLVRWMEQIAAGEPPLIFSDGEQTMDFIHVSDVARSNLLAAQADATDLVLNVASGTETSLNDLAKALMKTMNSDLGIEYRPVRKVAPVHRRLADTSIAQSAIDFRSRVSLEDGLANLVEWWRSEKDSGAGTVDQGYP